MSSNASPITVYLIDDEVEVRDSLMSLLESVCYTVKCFDSASAFLENYKPEQAGCLLLDLKMPSMNGLELQSELVARNITIPIIFISGNANVPETSKAFRTGAIDFLVKPFESDILFERIEEAIKKDTESRNKLIEQENVFNCFNGLTAREKEVLLLIINSYSNKEAAQILNISYRTIAIHRARVMKKMQAESIADLAAMAINYKLFNN